MNYLTGPYKSSKHVHVVEVPFDFNKRRALLLEGGDDDRITLTTVQDLANVVVRAVEFEGEWPVVGGIRGSDMSIGQLIALGEKIRGTYASFIDLRILLIFNETGGPFKVEKLNADELKSGTFTNSWTPKLDHPSIPPEQVDMLSKFIVAGILLAISAKGFICSDEWNRLLPDYKFTEPEEFLSEAWRGKP